MAGKDVAAVKYTVTKGIGSEFLFLMGYETRRYMQDDPTSVHPFNGVWRLSRGDFKTQGMVIFDEESMVHECANYLGGTVIIATWA